MNTKDKAALEWVRNDELGYDIWDKKYRHNNESFDEWLDRVSGGNPRIRKLIEWRRFLFGGRILANRGVEDQNSCYSNCFVITPCEDSIESIFDCAKKMARTFSYGGGCGLNIGNLAPRGAKVRNAAKTTTGSVSFMDLYSLVTGLIGQNNRRGALMISMPINHPDIEEFIECKSDLNRITKANISIMINDEFMKAVKHGDMYELSFTREATGEVIKKVVDAKKLFERIAELNWQMAEPGMLFWDTICNNNLLSAYDDFEYAGVNPCLVGDTYVSTTNGKTKIKDLVGTTPEVYCMGADGKITIKKAEKVWLTRKDAQVVLIETNRSKIKCTPNHLIYTKNKGWEFAAALKIDDEVASVKCAINDINEKKEIIGEKVINVEILSDYEDVYDMTVPDVHNFIANGMVVHNCAEEPLPAGGSCLLGSINLSEYVLDPYTTLSRFDFETYAEDVRTCIEALNEVLDEGIERLPLDEQKESAENWRQCGLGFMGLADAFIKLGIKYGDERSVELSSKIGEATLNNAVLESSRLALVHKPFPKYDSYKTQNSSMWHLLDSDVMSKVMAFGLRNSQLLTCPPCGSISNMIGCSSGIEPIFAKSYTRKTESLSGEDKYYKVYPYVIKEMMDRFEIDESSIPDYCVTSHEIDPMSRIDIQAAWQQFIDASISSTINLPESATVQDVMDIYMQSWLKGLKGVTIYRDNCSRTGILSTGEHEENGNISLGIDDIPRGYIIDVPEGLTYRKYKLNTGCGTLHLFVGIDEADGKIYDIFTNVGSSGCVVNTQAISRTISACIRGGIPIEYIVEQLNKAGSCPSWQYAKGKGKTLSKGKSCASAIANVLDEISKEIAMTDDKVAPEDSVGLIEDGFEVCPECGDRSLVYNNGCRSCVSCGWSKCG